jgi:hypothetical protein
VSQYIGVIVLVKYVIVILGANIGVGIDYGLRMDPISQMYRKSAP